VEIGERQPAPYVADLDRGQRNIER